MQNIPGLNTVIEPMLGFRFGVFFLNKIGLSHPLDFRFQQVNGLSFGVETGTLGNSDSGLNTRQFPMKLKTGELELIRGKPLISTLSKEIQRSFTEFKFKPRNVLLSVLDESALPINSWIFTEAYPVEWSLSGLDATANQVIIENMKLTYKTLKPFSL